MQNLASLAICRCVLLPHLYSDVLYFCSKHIRLEMLTDSNFRARRLAQHKSTFTRAARSRSTRTRAPRTPRAIWKAWLLNIRTRLSSEALQSELATSQQLEHSHPGTCNTTNPTSETTHTQ